MKRQVNRIIWHHSAGGTLQGAVAAMEAKNCHYHRLIDQKGEVYEMRDYNLIGYHSGPNGNTGSIGICLIGDFRYTRPTQAQLYTARDLAIEIEEIYGAVKYQNHCDVAATMCPVVDLSAIIRDAVLTAEKDKDNQSPKPMDEDEVAIWERAFELGITTVELEDFDQSHLICLEMCLNTYDILAHTLRSESDCCIESLSKQIEKLMKEKSGKSDKNGKAKV